MNTSSKDNEEQTETNNEIEPLSKAGVTTNSELSSKTKGFEKCVEFEEKNQEASDQNKNSIPLSIEEEPNKSQTSHYKIKGSIPPSFEDKLNQKRKDRYKDKKKEEENNQKNFELSYEFNPKRKKPLPKNKEAENTNIPLVNMILSFAFVLILAAFLTNTSSSLPKPVEGICDLLLKKYNKLCPKAIYTPKGFIIVNSMGAQILVDGKRVQSGEKTPVPANKKIKVKATDPLLDLTEEDSIEVNINETKNIYLPIKTSIKDRLEYRKRKRKWKQLMVHTLLENQMQGILDKNKSSTAFMNYTFLRNQTQAAWLKFIWLGEKSQSEHVGSLRWFKVVSLGITKTKEQTEFTKTHSFQASLVSIKRCILDIKLTICVVQLNILRKMNGVLFNIIGPTIRAIGNHLPSITKISCSLP